MHYFRKPDILHFYVRKTGCLIGRIRKTAALCAAVFHMPYQIPSSVSSSLRNSSEMHQMAASPTSV